MEVDAGLVLVEDRRWWPDAWTQSRRDLYELGATPDRAVDARTAIVLENDPGTALMEVELRARRAVIRARQRRGGERV